MNFFPLGYLHHFGLVTVHKSADPRVRPFAAIGFPGSVDLHLVKPVEPGVLIGVLERFRGVFDSSIPAAQRDPPRRRSLQSRDPTA